MNEIKRENAIIEIGMAAVVLRDVLAGLVAAGNPARPLKRVTGRNGASGQICHGRVARRCADALLQE
ncbi:hypothetical protein [Reyranella sp.]|uniref:hypothetical protein n=1 Tax=Reyranella sp. TaxID=1929291 RepID=UPI003D0D5392